MRTNAPENISISVWRPASRSCNVEYLADGGTALPCPEDAAALLISIPFAEAMATRFIRYYNRVGFPDIDVDYILNHLD